MKTAIPKVDLREIIRVGTVVEIHNPLGGAGNVSVIELVVIASLIRGRRPERLLEIGTLDGRTTMNMAANACPGAQIYTLDLPETRTTGAKFVSAAGDGLASRILQLYGDSAKFDFSPFYGSLDFIFIDADHSYEYVLSDSRQAIRLLRNGSGTIVWHDYDSWDWEGTTRALNHLYAGGKEFGNLRHIEGTSLVYLTLD
ncbi:MAG: class I SAM-dependent methyltransferase [Dehalococcoidia bacterium]|nr:class I SAM-dependent methyltransferase [Dehalococcoidia bacterium]